MAAPVTNWWNNRVYFLWGLNAKWRGSEGYSGENTAFSPATLNVKWKPFCFLRLNSTRNSKYDPKEETKLLSADTNLRNYQGIRTASVLRFCVWYAHLTQLTIVQWRDTIPCITCRNRLVASRVARTCSTSWTPFKLSPYGRNSAGVGLRFGLQMIFDHSFSL